MLKDLVCLKIYQQKFLKSPLSPLKNRWNFEMLQKLCFSKNLKLADVTPIYKKKNLNLAQHYRPVSVVPTVSKIVEKII